MKAPRLPVLSVVKPVAGGRFIQLNGEPAGVGAGETVAGLLERLGLDPRAVAVEHNGAILKRDRFAAQMLEPGDRVEVVHFVQGG